MNLELAKSNKENVKMHDLIKPWIGEDIYEVYSILDSGVFVRTLDGVRFPHVTRLDFDMFEIIKQNV